MANYIMFESASGYGLFEIKESEEIASIDDEVQASVLDMTRFSKLVKMKAFCPFKTAEEALNNINSVSEGVLMASLCRAFLTSFASLPPQAS